MATSKICMNKLCATTSSVEWKKGWVLGSGGFATLCSNCGSAFENLVFCETYHLEESGWRECSVCHKRLHCGCIASKFFYELLDIGGVACSTCARSLRPYSICRDEIPNEYGTPKLCHIGGSQPILLERRINGESVGKLKLLQLGKSKGLNENESNHLHQSQKDDMLGPLKRDDSVHALGDVSPGFLHLTQPSIGSSNFSTPGNPLNLGAKDMFESFAHSSLNLGFSSRSDPPSFTGRFPNTTAEETERGFTPSPFSQGQRPCPILAKSSKAGVQIGSEAKKVIVHQARVARPPAEGRGRSQLLPRYWPRITDQELQQLSGDLNSTIVPLFEKVLSASDAGRIGRLVLPKACAEAYFPPISQSDGTQIKIQDVKGKEWTFQFRYWPNNNSRMYVLEGVTPCIQSMQLQAGDTVIFSRIDPGGKLVIGSRKASNSSDTQEAETSSLQNGNVNGEPSLSGMSPVSRFSGLFHSLAENKDPHLNALSENLNLADGNMGWHKNDKKLRCKTTETVQPSVVSHEKKRTRNIGSKSKRLLIHSEDAMELKLTWEEAQDLLRPPPTVKPSIVTIEDHEFEEYAEPPVFGRRTIFTAGPSGIPEQWTQCDDCFKCRRLPVDALLPPKWTCVDNVWDSTRCSCSAPEDIDSKELEHIFKVGKDSKKRKVTENHTIADDHEPSGLDALASAAVLGEHVAETVEISAGATTRHPRHRPGCTCIVCIQPPSGKGKHKSSCTCNVCMTVKRRFKTLMLRKKIRQSEREAELAQKDTVNLKENSGKLKGASEDDLVPGNHAEVEMTPQSINKAEVGETSAGKIDLNCHPDREVQMQQEANAVMTMTGLVEAAGFPLESYMKRNGFGSLVFEQQASSSIPQGMDESEQVTTDDRQPESAVQPDCESKEEEKCSELAN